jgi:bifunctional polynucleotide phosphatase/kinase
MSWYNYENSLYHYLPNLYHFKSGFACFDLDWTLVQPKDTKFPRTYTDNYIMPKRIEKLKELIEKGYNIILFSNQKLSNKENLQFKLSRMADIIEKFNLQGIPLLLYMAVNDDKYRKPNTGMWDYFNLYMNSKGVKVSKEYSFYCGDAAGRVNDFSDSDKEFAKNIGIKFYIPEEVFHV